MIYGGNKERTDCTITTSEQVHPHAHVTRQYLIYAEQRRRLIG